MTIYPGSTVMCDFTVPFKHTAIQKAVVSFMQEGRSRLDAASESITQYDSNNATVTVTLSQTDTIKLLDGIRCKVQINLLMKDGSRIPSKCIEVDVGEQYYDRPIV